LTIGCTVLSKKQQPVVAIKKSQEDCVSKIWSRCCWKWSISLYSYGLQSSYSETKTTK